jgi:hypothetical protein
VSASSWAQPQTAPIVDRSFAADLYVGAAHGSQRLVGMGGVATALGDGAAGLLGNPGASALRPLAGQFERRRWDWDAALSAFVPTLGSDFDNNGRSSRDDFGARVGTFSLLGYYEAWALGLGISGVDYELDPVTSDAPAMTMTAGQARAILARTFLDGALGVGVGLRFGAFTLKEGNAKLFEVSGGSFESGVLVSPAGRSWRLGARAASGVNGGEVRTSCDPNDCRGRILPSRAVAPWEVAVGGAVRVGQGAWNGYHGGRFRDERSALVAADLVVVGSTATGAGVESFAAGDLQASGRSVTVSPRVGLEVEWFPGRLRLRTGGYYEPARFAGIPGRTHVTFGGELRLFAFHLWQVERRLALSAAADLASEYGNAGVSLGFWH